MAEQIAYWRNKERASSMQVATYKMKRNVLTHDGTERVFCLLETIPENVSTKSDDLMANIEDYKLIVKIRDDRIAMLESDLSKLKFQVETDRNKWQNIEKERSIDKMQLANQNTKNLKLDIELNECRSQLVTLEKANSALMADNEILLQQLQTEEESFEVLKKQVIAYQQQNDVLIKENIKLSGAYSQTEKRLAALEEIVDVQVQQNDEKDTSICQLREELQGRTGQLSEIKEEIANLQMVNLNQTSEINNEVIELTHTLDEYKEKISTLETSLMETTESLIEAQQLVQKKKSSKSQKVVKFVIKSKKSDKITNIEVSSVQECDEKTEIEPLNETISELNTSQRKVKSDKHFTKIINRFIHKRLSDKSPKKKQKSGKENNMYDSENKENIPPTAQEIQEGLARLRSNDRSQSRNILQPIDSTARQSNVLQDKTDDYKTKLSTVCEDEGQTSTEIHQFESMYFSNRFHVSEDCILCSKSFVNETVYQCKKCNSCVHQYCRGSNLKCSSSGTSEVSSRL